VAWNDLTIGKPSFVAVENRLLLHLFKLHLLSIMNNLTTIPEHTRQGAINPFAWAGLVLVGLVSAVAYFVDWGKATGLKVEPILVSVERGEFIAQVLDQGEIQSSSNVEIRCEAQPRNGELSVIEVVPEGTRVNEGDFLVRLDSTSFEVELETQKIMVANARTLLIQAEAEHETAKEALKEYEQGLYVEKRKLIENAIFDAKGLIETANQEQTLAKAVLEHSKKLQAKGFITSQQLEANEFAVKRTGYTLESAKNSLALAEQQLEVLETITKVKETVLLQSNIKAAEVKLRNQQESLNVELTKQAEIIDQIKKCEIRVPAGKSGQVVYAKESSFRGDDWRLEEGATVRARQVLIRLPSPNKMEVKALINEQSITQIRPGMPATIKVDALNNQMLTGAVTKVNQYAESNGWFGSSVRKYAVLVEILNPPPSLKPGMNAAVAIEVRYEKDAMYLPIQAVYAVQNRHFCLMRKGDEGWETREIEVDGDNTRSVLVKSGLESGEMVVMNPATLKNKMVLPESKLEQKVVYSDELRKRMDELSQQNSKEQSDLAIANDGPPGDQSAAREQSTDNTDVQTNQASSQPPAGQRPEFEVPASGAALVQKQDTDGDKKLTKAEAGIPYSYFFDRMDTNQDGFVDTAEADLSIKQMRQRRQSGEGGPRQ
jgi:multidrug resistance efflux pump